MGAIPVTPVAAPAVTVACVAHYEQLLAWKECHALALMVYRATEKFPSHERYGLTAQARRAAFSAAANIRGGFRQARRGGVPSLLGHRARVY
ncbi:MAG: four helix bundle protein [Gemmatimonadales bacterium]